MVFIIKDFRTIVFIFIVISTTFWPICPPAFFRCLSNSGEPSRNFKLRLLLNPWGSPVLIPLAITGYKYYGKRNQNRQPRGFNKGRSLKFHEDSRFRQTPKEGRRTYQPKRCGNSNKNEVNSLKTLNDKNDQSFVSEI